MSAKTISFSALLLLVTFFTMLELPSAAAEYPGVIELVGYSNRRARTHYMPTSYAGRSLDIPTMSPPAAKTQADIETVKQNIEKYNKLLAVDPKSLPESQKDMLERIVERVARLKESLDVEQAKLQQEGKNQTQKQLQYDDTSNTAATTEITTAEVESETESTLMLDETTLLQLQNSMDELAAAQAAVTAQTTRMIDDLPTTLAAAAGVTESDPDAVEATTILNDVAAGDDTSAAAAADYETTTDPQLTDATDVDDQFVAARSNNRNIAAITAEEPFSTGGSSSTPLSTTAGSARRQTSSLTTSGKIQKTRATKRPSSASTASKRVTGHQRPGGVSSTATAQSHKQSITTKQKLAAAAAAVASMATTQQQQQQKYKSPMPQAVTASTLIDQSIYQRTPQANLPTSLTTSTAAAAAAAGANYGAAGATNVGSVGAGGGGGGGVGVGGSISNDIAAYDPHVNTSAIIDSLNNAREEFYQQKQQSVNGKDKDKKTSATAKPTKYHYYPHNQHIYLLPECAIQQVCNAVYVRLNYTQPLCACPSRYRDPCSASLNEDDQHTTKLVGDGKKKAITLAKTCEATTEMRECRTPKDWSLLALQNTRTGKSHYLVICRCPDHFKMEGPMAHDQPTYASVPGIRVFGMMCVKPGYSVRKQSAQPPKRYQLQKPFYRPSSQNPTFGTSQYSNKDAYGRPSYGGSGSSSSSVSSNNNNNGYHQQDSFQNQHQANYHYLNRPESHGSINNNNYHPESISLSSFNGGGIYGRTNERKGETPIQAVTTSEAEETEALEPKTAGLNTSTPPAASEPRTTLSEESNAMEPVSSSSSAEGKRERRSIVEELTDLEDDSQIPEFPWDRVIEFHRSIVWD